MSQSSNQQPILSHERITLWLVRGLLALLLMLAVEVLFWNDPGGRELYEWPILLVGYLVLATIVPDLLVRYRVRDIWGVMAVVGLVCALNGLFLNPQSALADGAQTLLSRTLGAYWFISLEMVGVFLVLLGGHPWSNRRPLLIGAFVVGFFWAVWVKWYPAFFPGAYRAVTIYELFQMLAIFVLPTLVLALIVRRRTPAFVEHFRIPWQGYAVAGLLAMLLLIYQTLQNRYVDAIGIVLSLIVVGVLWAMLWFRADTQKPPLLATYLSEKPIPLWWLLLTLAAFIGMALFGFATDTLVNLFGLNQFTLLHLVFTLIGAGWIPLTAAVIGIRGITRQMQMRGY
ncbi:MAG: hypothetical protein KC546_00760 [Anaerolineae bacterium]|nr:hypothetical protein [Anaerolineae bacterium]